MTRTVVWVSKLAQHMAIRSSRGLSDVYKRLGSPQFHVQDPFDPVMKPVWELREMLSPSESTQKAVGVTMMAVGTAMVAPGGAEIAVIGALAVGTRGAIIAPYALYKITGLGLIVTGYLIYS